MQTLPRFALATSLAAALLCGCYAGDLSAYHDAGAAGATTAVPPASVAGAPCAVAELLGTYCVRCHSGSALAASDLPLTSYADLTATRDGERVADVALAKLSDTRRPMPPRGEPAPSAAQVQAFSDWIGAGAEAGGCADGALGAPDGAAGAPGAPSPYDTPTTCTSGSHWTSGNEESPKMHPGRACISCHSAEGEGPRFDVAGTLYASAHEPNDCNGAPLDTRVIITDATGRELVIAPNSVGNFSARRTNLVMPYTARLERGDRVREMVSAQSTGDCNGCHTESGKNEAPGRIMAP